MASSGHLAGCSKLNIPRLNLSNHTSEKPVSSGPNFFRFAVSAETGRVKVVFIMFHYEYFTVELL